MNDKKINLKTLSTEELIALTTKLIDENINKDKVIQTKDKIIKIKDDVISSNENIIKQLQEIIKKGNRKTFGRSSEKVDYTQLCLFNDVEDEIERAKQPKQKKVNEKKNKKLSEQVKEKVSKITDYRLSDISCQECHSEMREFKYDSNYTIDYIPASVSISENRIYSYICDSCNKLHDETIIVKADGPNQVIPKTVASSSLLANIIVDKYAYHTPLNRLETKYSNELGFTLSKQTMSNWLAALDELYLTRIYQQLVAQLNECDIIHADETPVAIIKHSQKVKNSRKSKKGYMWVYLSGATQENQVTIYDFKNNRNYINAKNFLKDYHGYIHCDGYDAYNNIDDTKTVGCFAHVRRYFFEALELIPESCRVGSKELAGVQYCDELFKIDTENPDDKLHKREEVLDSFKKWLDKVVDKTNPKLAIGKAINYTLNQWDKLVILAEDGRLEASNNRGERAIRPFTIGRKNWLFYFSENGAAVSSKIYSIVETCKLNKINVSKYFEYIFEVMSKKELNYDELNEILPTSKKIPSYLYLED